jgi:hypothetical protein
VTLGLTQGPAYGEWTVSLNGGPAVPLPGYAPALAVRDGVRVGTVPAEHGYARLRFVCTGKAAAASGLALGLDYVGWRRLVVEDAIEAETAELAEVKAGRCTDLPPDERCSGGRQLCFQPEHEGAAFTWLLPVPAAGSYDLAVYFVKSWDGASVRLSLNGKALGDFDTYAPESTWAGPTALGAFALSPGPQRLTVEVVGRNPLAEGLAVGIDCVNLRRR